MATLQQSFPKRIATGLNTSLKMVVLSRLTDLRGFMQHLLTPKRGFIPYSAFASPIARLSQPTWVFCGCA